jgi:hypothetical protein
MTEQENGYILNPNDPEVQAELYLLRWGNKGVVFSPETARALKTSKLPPDQFKSFLKQQDAILEEILNRIIAKYLMEGIKTPDILADVDHFTDKGGETKGLFLRPRYTECPECGSIKKRFEPYSQTDTRTKERGIYCGNCGIELATEKKLKVDGTKNPDAFHRLYG